MKRKYIDNLGIKYTETPQGWNADIGDNRLPRWEKERETYGFDERETWDIDYSFYLWLYERLMMYNEVNCINTEFHKFDFEDEVLTQQQCIDRMIEGCELFLDQNKNNIKSTDEEFKKAGDVPYIFAMCIHSLWW